MVRARRGYVIEAETLYRRAIRLCLMAHPPLPEIAYALSGLAPLLRAQKRHEEGESALRQALDIFRRFYGVQHPATIGCARACIRVLRANGRQEEARELELQFRISPQVPTG